MIGTMMKLGCTGSGVRVTREDAWKSVAVNLGGTLLLTALWMTLRIRLGGRYMSFGFLALGLLVEQEDGREDNKARDQRQPRALLDLIREVEHVADGSREDDEQGCREADEKHSVLAGHQVHRLCSTRIRWGQQIE